jgi:hypothetical protein
MSFVDCYEPYLRQWLITHLLSALLPFQPLFTEGLCRDQLFVPLLFSGALSEFLLPLLCASFQFVVYFRFFWWIGDQPAQGGYAGLSQGWLREYHVTLGSHLFGLLNVSQAGLELVSGGSSSPPVFSM